MSEHQSYEASIINYSAPSPDELLSFYAYTEGIRKAEGIRELNSEQLAGITAQYNRPERQNAPLPSLNFSNVLPIIEDPETTPVVKSYEQIADEIVEARKPQVVEVLAAVTDENKQNGTFETVQREYGRDERAVHESLEALAEKLARTSAKGISEDRILDRLIKLDEKLQLDVKDFSKLADMYSAAKDRLTFEADVVELTEEIAAAEAEEPVEAEKAPTAPLRRLSDAKPADAEPETEPTPATTPVEAVEDEGDDEQLFETTPEDTEEPITVEVPQYDERIADFMESEDFKNIFDAIENILASYVKENGTIDGVYGSKEKPSEIYLAINGAIKMLVRNAAGNDHDYGQALFNKLQDRLREIGAHLRDHPEVADEILMPNEPVDKEVSQNEETTPATEPEGHQRMVYTHEQLVESYKERLKGELEERKKYYEDKGLPVPSDRTVLALLNDHYARNFMKDGSSYRDYENGSTMHQAMYAVVADIVAKQPETTHENVQQRINEYMASLRSKSRITLAAETAGKLARRAWAGAMSFRRSNKKRLGH